jgi:hypothetical protein
MVVILGFVVVVVAGVGGVEWKVGVGQTKGGKILILLHLGTSERWERVSGIHTHGTIGTLPRQPAGGRSRLHWHLNHSLPNLAIAVTHFASRLSFPSWSRERHMQAPLLSLNDLSLSLSLSAHHQGTPFKTLESITDGLARPFSLCVTSTKPCHSGPSTARCEAKEPRTHNPFSLRAESNAWSGPPLPLARMESHADSLGLGKHKQPPVRSPSAD